MFLGGAAYNLRPDNRGARRVFTCDNKGKKGNTYFLFFYTFLVS